MEDFLQNDNCSYSLNSLKPHLYVFARGTVNAKTDSGHAEAIVENGTNPDVYMARSVIYSENASLDERYAFKKTLTVEIDGYNNELYSLNGIIGIETMDGTVFVLNPEFDATSTYEYRLDDNDDRTEYTFNIQSNYPTLKTNYTNNVSDECKSLKLNGSGNLYMIESQNASINHDGDIMVSEALKRVEYNDGSLVFTETASGGVYTQKLTFNINFGSYKAYWAYDMIEFLYNTYAVKIERKGYDYLLCGWQGESGMIPKYSIETAQNDKGTDVITMTFTKKGMYPIVVDDADITDEELTTWEFVEGANGRSAMVCVGNGVAMYTLKRELNAFGVPTGRYMQHTDYNYSGWGIDLVNETFDEYKSKEDPSCEYGGCWWMEKNMPSIVEFNYPMQQKTFTLQNACGFEIVNRPAWLQVNVTDGAPEEIVNITTVNNSYTEASGYMTVMDANGIPVVTKFVYDPTHIINNKNRSATALGQTLIFTLNVPVDYLQIYGMSENITVSLIQPDVMEITIPRNDTGDEATHTVSVRNTVNGQTDTATINQDKIYTKRVLNGYICDNGDKYERYQIYEAYSEYGNYIKTDTYETGNLIEADSIDCIGYQEKWEDLGDYVCEGDKPYHAIMKFVTYDGILWVATGEMTLGAEWRDSNLQIGNAILCRENAVDWKLTDKWQCLEEE